VVGVPVSDQYQLVDTKLQQKYREEAGIDAYKRVLFVTGGGNGADQLNKIVADNVPALLERYKDLAIVHQAGRALEKWLNARYDDLLSKVDRPRVMVKGFVTDLYRYSGAADVIVARGGATGLAEFAVQRKACIIIPSKQLVWQVHHARTLASQHAIIDLAEQEAHQPGRFIDEVCDLFDHPAKREQLASALHEFARPDAAKSLAMVLLEKMRPSR